MFGGGESPVQGMVRKQCILASLQGHNGAILAAQQTEFVLVRVLYGHIISMPWTRGDKFMAQNMSFVPQRAKRTFPETVAVSKTHRAVCVEQHGQL